jgi:hypothetical protein
VANVRDGRLTLFVNGTPRSSAAVPKGIDRSGSGAQIGAYGGRAVWKGRIDEVAIYGQPLTLAQIATHFRLGSTGASGGRYPAAVRSVPGLTSYYRLDERKGPAVNLATGAAPGRYAPGVARGAPGLISGDPDRSASFDGRRGAVGIPPGAVPRSASTLGLEAWVTWKRGGPAHVLSRPGAWDLRGDGKGGWAAEVRTGGAIALAAVHGIKPPPKTGKVRQPSLVSPGGGAIAFIAALLIVIAGILGVMGGTRRRAATRAPAPSGGRA